MRISKNNSYLFISKNDHGKGSYNASILSEYSDVINKWNSPVIRISPIFPLEETFLNLNFENTCLKGNNYLIFLNYYSPDSLDIEVFNKCNIWLTYGCYNIVCLTNDISKKEKILKWLFEKKIIYEVWEIKNGEIVNDSFVTHHLDSISSQFDYKYLIENLNNKVTQHSLREFITLINASISRAEYTATPLLFNLYGIRNYISSLCKTTELNDLEKSGLITIVNACVARLSSQTLSGISPILKTESHLWGHSLFGIGTANIALNKACRFIHHKMLQSRISEKFFSLLEQEDNEKMQYDKIPKNNAFWKTDKLSTTQIENDKEITPVLSYFSGRDGFRSNLTTLSVPLESLYSCNTPFWNLRTITHEISHIIIRSVIAKLYPNLDSEDEIKKLFENIKNSSNPTKIKEKLQRFFTLSIADLNINYVINNYKELYEVLKNWYSEVEEILTHVFDFLYFYRSDEEKYIHSLWLSWSVIPSIKSRVPEYVNRSICALLSKTYVYDNAEELAKNKFVEILKNLKKSIKSDNVDYIDNAISYIEQNWENKIKKTISSRKNLVKFVNSFLYSESIAASINSESMISSSGGKGKFYTDMKELELIKRPISNPLLFIEQYSESYESSPAESLWIYYNIAFNYDESFKI